MTYRIVSLGGINVDFEVCLPRRPETGETMIADRFLMHGGGKGANVAYCAARLGADCSLAGSVGSDSLKEEALGPLRAVGVDVSHVRTVQGESTGVALLILQPDGSNMVLVASNANAEWTEDSEHALDTVIRGTHAGSVSVTDLEVPVGTVRQAVKCARDRGIITVVDPAPAGRMPVDIYESIDFLTPNDLEAEELTGVKVRTIEDAGRAGRILLEAGVGTVLVKIGAEGCVLVSPQTTLHVAGFSVPVVDTTGAGDAFAGGLAVALMEGFPVAEAARFAVATSALSVTKMGCQPSYPSRTEVEDLLRGYQQSL